MSDSARACETVDRLERPVATTVASSAGAHAASDGAYQGTDKGTAPQVPRWWRLSPGLTEAEYRRRRVIHNAGFKCQHCGKAEQLLWPWHPRYGIPVTDEVDRWVDAVALCTECRRVARGVLKNRRSDAWARRKVGVPRDIRETAPPHNRDNLTLAELAARVGVSRSTSQRWVQRRVIPTAIAFGRKVKPCRLRFTNEYVEALRIFYREIRPCDIGASTDSGLRQLCWHRLQRLLRPTSPTSAA